MNEPAKKAEINILTVSQRFGHPRVSPVGDAQNADHFDFA